MKSLCLALVACAMLAGCASTEDFDAQRARKAACIADLAALPILKLEPEDNEVAISIVELHLKTRCADVVGVVAE